jgi:putative acetyltransferase
MIEMTFRLYEGFGAATAKTVADLLREDDVASEVKFDDPGEEEVRLWKDDIVLTAWNGDHFAGFGRARKDGWVTHVFVRPEYRRQGLGSRILSGLEERLHAKGRKVVLLGAEPRAVGFFRINGWNPVEPVDVLAKEPLVGRRLLLIPMKKTIGG